MKERLLKIVEGSHTDVVQQLKDEGVRVLHRFGDTLVVEGEPTKELTPALLRSTRIIPVEPPLKAPAKVADKDLALLAFQLRQTEGFRRSKTKRATEGQDWDSILERM